MNSSHTSLHNEDAQKTATTHEMHGPTISFQSGRNQGDPAIIIFSGIEHFTDRQAINRISYASGFQCKGNGAYQEDKLTLNLPCHHISDILHQRNYTSWKTKLIERFPATAKCFDEFERKCELDKLIDVTKKEIIFQRDKLDTVVKFNFFGKDKQICKAINEISRLDKRLRDLKLERNPDDQNSHRYKQPSI